MGMGYFPEHGVCRGRAALKSMLLMPMTLLCLAGCMAGPDFKSPAAPDVRAYTSTPLPEATASADVKGGAAQRLILGAQVPDQWWLLFKSEPLDRLVRAALTDSPDLAAARARLRQAKEAFNTRFGSVAFPSVDAGMSGARAQSTLAASGLGEGKGGVFNLYNASVNVTYTLDIFGGNRRALEALKATIDYENFQLEAAYLTLASNVVTAAIREAALREELEVMRQIMISQEKQLKMVEAQFELGGVSKAEVLAQSAQVQATRAAVIPVEKQLAQARNQIAVLTGKFPEAAEAITEFRLESIHLPEDLPVSLPSVLAHQRPDIRAAEALLHAASAQVGVAAADLYPKITLSGSYGPQASTIPHLADTNNIAWNVGAGVLAPVFNGGSLRAKKRAADAAYDEALARYQGVVLAAFGNVADVLRALEADARSLKAQADAVSVAKDALEMTEQQFSAGAVGSALLFNADRQYQQARIGLVHAQAARFADTAALFQALGGSWD